MTSPSSDIDTWFNSFDRLTSVAIGAVVFYILIVAMTRVTGKRTTSQMNNFDWMVTVAVGSLAASGILLKDVSIADAALGIAIMFALQWATSWLVLRSDVFSKLIKAEPRMLLHKGELQKDAMRAERISEAEIYNALRQKGHLSLDDANWVILENDGKFSIIPRDDTSLDNAQLMKDVGPGSS
ncbi:DUF421 domain-containing protein [Aurantiacibacter poecillastricola]|uniref:DUF421 domain-containing protein n=1 Tax=Aurantiacibacter poecillastricola TaxID=3064385 RepID=UPI00273D8418|nr:YetF domain-containing protein [Aurantiacibacter sp. 219JJ12-13]MDP5260971.1 DUF421 domain-containing protein [Aurantiacibacter sp. 219JJ12-13]